jgi:hypothetical protein
MLKQQQKAVPVPIALFSVEPLLINANESAQRRRRSAVHIFIVIRNSEKILTVMHTLCHWLVAIGP